MVEDCIPKLVDDQSNNILTMMPSELEIHDAVQSLNKDGASGPDGFGAIFLSYLLEDNQDGCHI